MATSTGPPLTEFARKYGVCGNTNRSGLTPLDPSFPYIGQRLVWDTRNYQRGVLYGFTSEELSRLDCLPTRELNPGNLQNGIIPLLRRENWEVEPCQPEYDRDYLYPLKNGRGYWTAANDEVWNGIEPAVVLASRMIMSTHLMPCVCQSFICVLC